MLILVVASWARLWVPSVGRVGPFLGLMPRLASHGAPRWADGAWRGEAGRGGAGPGVWRVLDRLLPTQG